MNKWWVIGVGLILLASGVCGQAVDGKNLVVVLEKGPGKLVSHGAYTEQGPATIFGSEGNFNGTIRDFDQKELFSFTFFFNNTQVVEGAGSMVTTAKKELVLPYYSNAAWVDINDTATKQSLSIPVGFLADTCGNHRCEITESAGDCPQDCSSNGVDQYCNPQANDGCDLDCAGGLDPDCQADSNKPVSLISPQAFVAIATGEQNKQITTDNWGFIAVLIGLVVALVWVGFRIQKDRAKPSGE